VLSSLGYRRPKWQKDALCIEHQNVNFHPGRGQSAEPALQVCGRCLVRAECLEWAMSDVSLFGVLGGTSYKTRRARHALDLRRAKARPNTHVGNGNTAEATDDDHDE